MKKYIAIIERKSRGWEYYPQEAAIKLHKSGWTNFIDEETTTRLLKLKSYEKANDPIVGKPDTA